MNTQRLLDVMNAVRDCGHSLTNIEILANLGITDIPVNPAPKGPLFFNKGEALNHNGLLRGLLASILLRADLKELTFTQADLNAVAGLILLEGEDDEGNLLIGLGMPGKAPS